MSSEDSKIEIASEPEQDNNSFLINGEELLYAANALISLLLPVAITMILTALVVSSLHVKNTNAFSAYMVYDENENDDNSTKLTGAIENALIFIAAITVITFLMVLLYYLRCIKLIFGWLIISVIMLLGVSGTFLVSQFVVKYVITIDMITFYFIMYNFAVGGAVSIFYHVPEFIKHSYLVAVSVIMAFVLTLIPEWTNWALIIALAVYDICAVLTPCGPLKWLLNLAQRRREPIPALLYEATPDSTSGETWNLRKIQTSRQIDEKDDNIAESPRSQNALLEQKESYHPLKEDTNVVPLPVCFTVFGVDDVKVEPAEEPVATAPRQVEEEDSEDRSIKLGLGDFVFYSVLVGRASLFGFTTAAACFMAILGGLALTLILLAAFQKALPALPFSIALGVIFYFISRSILWPFFYELTMNLIII